MLIPAFFKETLVFGSEEFDLSRRARPLRDAIRLNRVRAFAPSILWHEFLRVSHRKAGRLRTHVAEVDAAVADEQVLAFLHLNITAVPLEALSEDCWRVAAQHRIALADAWYIACAAAVGNVEYWLSHDHRDGVVAAARSVGVEVRLLTNDRF